MFLCFQTVSLGGNGLAKMGVVRILVIFQHTATATSMVSSRRDLLNDMAEHMSILKNNQNTHFSLTYQHRPMFSHINGKPSPRPFE